MCQTLLSLLLCLMLVLLCLGSELDRLGGVCGSSIIFNGACLLCMILPLYPLFPFHTSIFPSISHPLFSSYQQIRSCVSEERCSSAKYKSCDFCISFPGLPISSWWLSFNGTFRDALSDFFFIQSISVFKLAY